LWKKVNPDLSKHKGKERGGDIESESDHLVEKEIHPGKERHREGVKPGREK